MGAGLLDDERVILERQNKKPASEIVIALSIALCIPLFLLLILCSFMYDFWNLWPPEFWVKVPAVEGLDRSTDAVAAPTFHITLRVNYEREGNHLFWPLCGEGGRVDVAYDGVPIAHGDLPEFCVPAGIVGSVPIVATSEGLGLPDELYERMESQRQRGERVPLAVRVQIDKLTGSRRSPVVLGCTAILHGQPKGPFICPMVK